MLALVMAAAIAGTPASAAYPASFYAPFAPTTALDMVQQTPGFTLREGADRRGLAGSAGNVLIDGERPSAKAVTLADLLAQIPAAQVERIEILRGAAATGGSEAQGLVANVVRKRTAARGSWTVDLRENERGHLAVGLVGNWSGPTPLGEASLGVTRSEDYYDTRGRRLTGPVGGPTVTRIDVTPRNTTLQAANAQLKRPVFGGDGRVNLSLRDLTYKNFGETRSPVVAGRDRATADISDLTRTAEVGADWERAYGPATLRLVGLATERRYRGSVDAAVFDTTGARTSRQVQQRRTETSETVARAVVEWPLGGHRLQVGAEGARNLFDAALKLDLDTGAGPRPIVLPAANVHLQELRAEVFVQDSVSLGALRLEARLAAEASRLTQSGDTVLETRLAYVKPSLQVSGPAPGGGVVRLKLFRDVSQLNFEDFVSFASFAEERVVGGNPDLRPQTQWRLEGGYNRPFGTRGAVDIIVYRTWARDVADFVPLLGRFDAPGNIGPGRFWGAALKLTAPLDAVVPGGLVNLKVQLDESRVTDPTTGRTRRASGLATHYSKLEFRQDLPRWRAAWGVSVEDVGAVTFYRRAEIERTDQTRRLDAFVEHAVTPRLKLRVYGANITNWLATRQRTFFAGGRTGPATSFERRERNPGRWFGVEMRGTF